MSWRTAINDAFPKAISGQTLSSRLLTKLKELGFAKSTTLLAPCMCRDEICEPFVRPLKNHFNNLPFDLNGLGAYPVAGLTGFGAMSHHVPDDGSVVIIYASHIGVNPTGELGKVVRIGMSHETTSCGALCAYLGKLEADKSYQVVDNPNDMEQVVFEKALAKLEFSDLTDATKKLSVAIGEQLKVLIDRSGMKMPVALVGGVLINTSPGEDDYFSLDKAVVLNYQKKEGVEHDFAQSLA